MLNLLELLARELERPRPVTPQVVNHLIATYGADRARIAEFLTDRMTSLEDFEFELVLAPLFTPGLRDQAVFAEFLGCEPVARETWAALVQQLAERPTIAQLLTPDGRTVRVPLRPVVIERYLHRLRLDGRIARPLFELIESRVPPDARPVLKAVARRAIWNTPARTEILNAWLDAALATRPFPVNDAIQLLQLVETYEPPDLDALRAFIPHWQTVLRQEIRDAAAPHPFLNERIQEMHGGARDQRRPNETQMAAKREELALLERLWRIFER